MKGPIRDMLVGIFILGAIALCVGIIMFLKPAVGDGKQIVYVRFSDIGSITVGTRVLFAGKPVGEVVALQEIPDARGGPTDELGRVYIYQLTLQIDSNVKLYNTDEIAIQTSGLLGEKSIAIIPKSPPKGMHPTLITGQPIYADSVDPLQSAIVDFSDLAANMEEAFGQFSLWMREHGDMLAETILSTKHTMDQINQAVTSFNEKNIVDQINQSMITLNATLDQIHRGVTQLEQNQAFTNAAEMICHLNKSSLSIEEISQTIAAGKGTLGKIIMEDTLYLELKGLMSRANTLMNDMTQYGLLFHLNKQWQRQQKDKQQLMQTIQSPCSLQSYLTHQIDTMEKTVGALSTMMEQAEETPGQKGLLGSRHFNQKLSQLEQQALDLNDTLHIYQEYKAKQSLEGK